VLVTYRGRDGLLLLLLLLWHRSNNSFHGLLCRSIKGFLDLACLLARSLLGVLPKRFPLPQPLLCSKLGQTLRAASAQDDWFSSATIELQTKPTFFLSKFCTHFQTFKSASLSLSLETAKILFSAEVGKITHAFLLGVNYPNFWFICFMDHKCEFNWITHASQFLWGVIIQFLVSFAL
jgi:hypothetical protein